MLLRILLLFLFLVGCVNGKGPPTPSAWIHERNDDTGEEKHQQRDTHETKVNLKEINFETRSERSVSKCRRFVGGFCDECYDGFHGNNCQYTCSERCADGCFQENGLCRACPPGYHGSLCDQICPLFCRPSYDLRKYCGISSGHCLEGCQLGHWGPRCTNYCKNCINTTCIYTDGSCIDGCKAGSWGKTCDKTCPNHCESNTCSVSGQCINGCTPGWFGNTCELMCSKHCKDSVCNGKGYCLKGCLPGFTGHNCSQSCPPHCHTCDQNKTQCFACNSGFTGHLCETDSHTSKLNENKTLSIISVTLLSALVIGVISWMVRKARVDGRSCLSVGSGLKCHDLYRTKQQITILPMPVESESFV